MIVADTNVVSEFMKPTPDPVVMAWARSLDPGDLTICVVTVEEVERGLGRLPEGRRRDDLERRWATLVDAFGAAIADYDRPAASEAAQIQVAALASGRSMSLADAEIAGICLAGGFQLATRNVKDFAPTEGLAVFNPFDPPSPSR